MSNDYQHLTLHREGHVLTVSMSNPPLHTMVPTEVVELNTMMTAVEGDEELRVLVLTGASDEYFVRHYDVGQLAEASEGRRAGRSPARSPDDVDPQARSFQGFMRRMEAWQGITIAALNGNAAGGGFELALACDFRVMRDGDFQVALPETGVGIIPGAGGTQRMPRLIGMGRAMDLIVHGTRLSPQAALELGLVHRVFQPASWDDDVRAFAQGIAGRAPLAIRAAKRAIREGMGLAMDEGIALEGRLFGELMQSDDAAMALRAVADGKVPGGFKGR